MTQDAVANRYGPSTATLRLIEDADDRVYRQKTWRELEESLEWEQGSIVAISEGREPLPVQSVRAKLWAAPSQPPPAERAPGAPVLSGAAIRDMVTFFMLARGATDDEADEFIVSLGLPERSDLTAAEWGKIADRLALSSAAVENVARFASQGAGSKALPGGLRQFRGRDGTIHYIPEGVQDPQSYVAEFDAALTGDESRAAG